MSDITCGTCGYWSRSPALATATRRPEGASPDLGCCLAGTPLPVAVGDSWFSLFPETHRGRWCRDWTPGEEPDGDGNVVPFPKPAA